MTDPRIARIARRQAAQTTAARLTITPLLADTDATTEAAVAALFDPWTAGHTYTTGDMATVGTVVWRCVQGHTSQADWTPAKTPALWTAARKTTGSTPDAWKQPTGAQDAYTKGDRVTHGGKTWVSTVDANVWEPGIYGWTAQ